MLAPCLHLSHSEPLRTPPNTPTNIAAWSRSDEERSKMIEDMAAAFDSASSLCAFNGVRFDIPFLATAFSLNSARVSEWVIKTSDILEFSRLVLSSTFSLDLLCKHNNIQTKSASGLEAVRMAANGEWDRLRDYCTDDVRILCDIYRLRMVTHPRSARCQI